MTQQPSEKGKVSRRDFLKLLTAAGTVMSFTPFIDWGKFMPNPVGGNLQKAEVILPDGSQANAKTFPPNSSQAIRYPETGDRVLDEEPFRRWQFIRLPPEYGGDKEDASSFRAYSMVCLHLWCLWKYWPEEGRKRGECPCHGSMYDPRTGKAFAGPASLQSPPSNVLPRLDLEVDNKGGIWIVPPVFSANANGIVGYGRLVKGLNV